MSKFFSRITFLDKAKGEKFNAFVGFTDDDGNVLVTVKKTFRKEEDAIAFTTRTYTLGTLTESNEVTGETQNVYTCEDASGK